MLEDGLFFKVAKALKNELEQGLILNKFHCYIGVAAFIEDPFLRVIDCGAAFNTQRALVDVVFWTMMELVKHIPLTCDLLERGTCGSQLLGVLVSLGRGVEVSTLLMNGCMRLRHL